jgi:hypothetical protein
MFLQLFLLFIIIFFFLPFYISARLHLCALSFRTMVFAAPDWAERTPKPPPPPLHLWAGCSLGMAQAYSLPSATEGMGRRLQRGGQSRVRNKDFGFVFKRRLLYVSII